MESPREAMELGRVFHAGPSAWLLPPRLGPFREGASELSKQPAVLRTAGVVSRVTPVRTPVRIAVRGAIRAAARVAPDAVVRCFRRGALARMAVPPPTVGLYLSGTDGTSLLRPVRAVRFSCGSSVWVQRQEEHCDTVTLRCVTSCPFSREFCPKNFTAGNL